LGLCAIYAGAVIRHKMDFILVGAVNARKVEIVDARGTPLCQSGQRSGKALPTGLRGAASLQN